MLERNYKRFSSTINVMGLSVRLFFRGLGVEMVLDCSSFMAVIVGGNHLTSTYSLTPRAHGPPAPLTLACLQRYPLWALLNTPHSDSVFYPDTKFYFRVFTSMGK